MTPMLRATLVQNNTTYVNDSTEKPEYQSLLVTTGLHYEMSVLPEYQSLLMTRFGKTVGNEHKRQKQAENEPTHSFPFSAQFSLAKESKWPKLYCPGPGNVRFLLLPF